MMRTMSTSTMRERAYTIHIAPDPEGNGYTVDIPALPDVITFGVSVERALESAREAIDLHVRGLEEDGLAVPEDPAATGTYVVRVAA